ncbi:hypothetical protein H4R34_002323 [Dimargaris verticillata]|uniref:ERCC4 domain-containing protein n=1 Tax=Dimargaris verticillata TaxID=2761393 RepID=A0A9W8EE63_9FUNG|nr:hypothetical protein H4R34_002323 [Dimargaris verticillata]
MAHGPSLPAVIDLTNDSPVAKRKSDAELHDSQRLTPSGLTKPSPPTTPAVRPSVCPLWTQHTLEVITLLDSPQCTDTLDPPIFHNGASTSPVGNCCGLAPKSTYLPVVEHRNTPSPLGPLSCPQPPVTSASSPSSDDSSMDSFFDSTAALASLRSRLTKYQMVPAPNSPDITSPSQHDPLEPPSSPLSCASQATEILTESPVMVAMRSPTLGSIAMITDEASDDELDLPSTQDLLTRSHSSTLPSTTSTLLRTHSQPMPMAESLPFNGCINAPPSLLPEAPLPRATKSYRRAQSVEPTGSTKTCRQQDREARKQQQLLAKEQKRLERQRVKEARVKVKQHEQQIKRINRAHVDKLECTRELTVLVSDSLYQESLSEQVRSSAHTYMCNSPMTHSRRSAKTRALATGHSEPGEPVTLAVGDVQAVDDNSQFDPGSTLGAYIEARVGWHFHARVQQVTCALKHIVRWERRVLNRFDPDQGLFVPLDTLPKSAEPEPVILLWWPIEQMTAFAKDNAQLHRQCTLLQSQYPHIKRTLVIVQGYEQWKKKQLQKRDREFAQQVRQAATLAADAGPAATDDADANETSMPASQPTRRKRRPSQLADGDGLARAAILTVETVDELLAWIQFRLGWLITHTRDIHDSVHWITVYTRDIAASRYKDRSSLVFGAEGGEPGADSARIDETTSSATNLATFFTVESGVTKAQWDPADVWRHLLLQIPRVTAAMADAIVQHYPSLQSLYQAYQRLADQSAQAEQLLANLSLGAQGRRIGPVMSAKIYHVFTSTDPNYRAV